ncbi:MAG: hypothetical protein M1829_001203 [Trizodia sp. TS-e1964]|nr:MAG: hypothetical protein M1829_001203 [Trizodia sp. TS-e1964]
MRSLTAPALLSLSMGLLALGTPNLPTEILCAGEVFITGLESAKTHTGALKGYVGCLGATAMFPANVCGNFLIGMGQDNDLQIYSLPVRDLHPSRNPTTSPLARCYSDGGSLDCKPEYTGPTGMTLVKNFLLKDVDLATSEVMASRSGGPTARKVAFGYGGKYALVCRNPVQPVS